MHLISHVCVIVACFDVATLQASLPCPVLVSCALKKDVVWASDGEVCYPFYNSCFLFNANCSRKNKYEKTLETQPKEECQKLCRTMCTREYNPVCAAYEKQVKTFSTRCTLEAHACSTGEAWMYVRDGECENSTIE